MTGDPNQAENELDVYFQSIWFIKTLDEIRSTGNTILFSIYALQLQHTLGLLHRHTGVIENYLRTGEYDPDAVGTAERLVDYKRKLIPTEPDPPLSFYTYVKSTQEHWGGVSITLTGTTRQDELIRFIKENWSEIQKSLDANFPNRRKRFSPVNNIDNYLMIADKVKNRDKTITKAKLIANLAVECGMDTADVAKVAKKYQTLYWDS